MPRNRPILERKLSFQKGENTAKSTDLEEKMIKSAAKSTDFDEEKIVKKAAKSNDFEEKKW